MKKIIYRVLLIFSFLFLLCFPQSTLLAASRGLTLWFDTLVPTLLPVMILSSLLVETNLAASLTAPFNRPLGKLLGLSPYGVYAMLTGLTCGYPLGAKVVSDLRRRDRISRREGIYLAAFCNNVSPAFVLSYLVNQHLASGVYALPTLAILCGAPVLYALFTNRRFRQSTDAAPFPENKASFTAPDFAMIDACIVNSIQSITKLGGYIILFSIFTAMAELLPGTLALPKACLAGLLEITTGIRRITELSLPFAPTYLLLAGVTSFGGLCSAAQSDAMLEDIGLSMKQYLTARLFIAAIAVLLAACYAV